MTRLQIASRTYVIDTNDAREIEHARLLLIQTWTQHGEEGELLAGRDGDLVAYRMVRTDG